MLGGLLTAQCVEQRIEADIIVVGYILILLKQIDQIIDVNIVVVCDMGIAALQGIQQIT